MSKLQKVGATTNKKSEVIQRQTDFSKRWNINFSENFVAFNNRIIVILDGLSFNSYWMPRFEREVFYQIGQSYVDQNYSSFSFSFSKTYLYKFLNKLDLSKKSHQMVLISLLESILNSGYDIGIPEIARKISEALVLSGINIEIYKRGSEYLFYPSGAEILDAKLVNDNLNWLEFYPKAREKMHTALSLQQRNGQPRQIIDNMRLCFELFLKQYLNNEKSLENQKELLGKKLKESAVSKEIRDMYATLFSFYTTYNNQNVKHADNCLSVETEYIIYLTGTFIRFLIQVNKQEEKKNG